MEPLISVIIPTYNSEIFIEECLNSIISQTYKNIEIIIVDDGSSDGTVDIIKNQYLNCVRLLEQSNQKVAMARHNGLQVVNGDYVAFCDHDDIWFPDKIRQQVDLFHNDSKISLVHTDALEYNIDTHKSVCYSELHTGVKNNSQLLHCMLIDYAVPLMSTVMVKVEALKNNKIYFSDMTPGVDDLGVFVALLVCGEKFHFIDEVLVTRKMHSNNQSSDYELRFSRRIELYTRLLKMYSSIFLRSDMNLIQKALSDAAYRVAHCKKNQLNYIEAKNLFLVSWINNLFNIKPLIKYFLYAFK